MADHDVIISGAGPAGLLLGCLLAQAGRDVVVFERSTGPDERARAIGIHAPGLAAVRMAGIEERVRAEALELSGGVVTSRGRTLADVDFPPGSPILTLPQKRTNAILLTRLAELQPDAVRRGAEVVHALDDSDGVHVSVAARGIIEQHRAPLLVVAEGVRSTLRERRGFGWRRIPGAGHYSMLDLPDGGDDRRARLHLEPEGVVESFPLPGGGHRWVLRERERISRTPESFRKEIRRRSGIDIGPTDIEPTAFRARQHRAARLVQGRIALLGDAAHEISPIGGQGMNLAWIAACRLAVAVTERADRDQALGAYERVTLRSAAAAQRRAGFNMAMGASMSSGVSAARDLAIRALAHGPAGERLVGVMTMRGL